MPPAPAKGELIPLDGWRSHRWPYARIREKVKECLERRQGTSLGHWGSERNAEAGVALLQ